MLFLDEIQECEEAIQSLRYFKEELPELHVIAAGSLLDFTLERIGMPVGRVQFLHVYPLSFGEYLEAMGKSDLHRFASQALDVPPALHEKLLEEFRYYCWLGGMPAVVDAWRQHQNPQFCQEIQDQIIQAYRQDFEKYAKKHQVAHITKIFDQVGLQLGQKFKYSKVDADLRSAPLKEALSLLSMAGIVYRCYHTAAQGLPLSALMDVQKMKVFFFDIGLLQRIQGVRLRDWLLAPMSVTYLGALAEQWVAQEYIALTSISAPPDLFYWQREAKQSNAEIDFLFNLDQEIVPVEVKSGSGGRLRSLALFMESHPHSKQALVVSERAPWKQCPLQGIPFYALERILLQKENLS